MSSLVSVIIPAYNREKYIAQCVESVINQTYKNIEIIVVDDGSTDNTSSIVESIAFQNGDKNIVCIKQANSGPQCARNNGFKNANGQYVVFLDSDDYWVATKIEKQLKLIEGEPNTVLVYTNCIPFSTEGELDPVFVTYPPYRGSVFEKLYIRNFVPSPTPLIRKSAIEGEPFDLELNKMSGQDWDLWLSLSKKGNFDYLDEPLAYYRIHDSNMTAFIERRVKGQSRVIGKHRCDLADDELYHKAMAQMFQNFGDEYAEERDYKKAIEMYRKASSHSQSSGLFWRRFKVTAKRVAKV